MMKDVAPRRTFTNALQVCLYILDRCLQFIMMVTKKQWELKIMSETQTFDPCEI